MPDASSLIANEPRPLPGEKELALAIALLDDERDGRCFQTVMAAFDRIPEIQRLLVSLIGRARRAGIVHEGPPAMLSALVLEEQLDLLIASEGWQRAEDVLDPRGEAGVDHASLLRLAQARCRSLASREFKPRLEHVIHRLEAASNASKQHTF